MCFHLNFDYPHKKVSDTNLIQENLTEEGLEIMLKYENVLPFTKQKRISTNKPSKETF